MVVVLPLVEGGGDELLVSIDFILHSAGVVAVGMDEYLAQKQSYHWSHPLSRCSDFFACQNWGRFSHSSAQQSRVSTMRFT